MKKQCQHKHQINGWEGKALMGKPVMCCMDCGAIDKLDGKGFKIFKIGSEDNDFRN